MANLTMYRPMVELQREVDRMFDRLFQNPRESNTESYVWNPPVDLKENENAYVLTMDLPGLNKEDVQVTFENGILQITGERTHVQDEKQPKYHHLERWYGRFFRQLRFDQTVNSDGIQAAFDRGVLIVTIPKAEESKPRRIAIS